MKKEFNLKEPFVKKTGTRDINNLFSGYEFGGKAKTTAAIAGVGYVTLGVPSSQYNEDNLIANAQEMDVESLPGTRGDMTGYQATPGVGMEANGDLVFALHKLRHGG